MNLSLDLIVPILAAVLASYVTWFLARKKTNAETDKLELEIIQTWKNIADDLRGEVTRLTDKCDHLAHEVETFRKENMALKKELKDFEILLKTKLI
jgi:predicted RNase H-like nuclease (RuvC/YqgF family)